MGLYITVYYRGNYRLQDLPVSPHSKNISCIIRINKEEKSTQKRERQLLSLFIQFSSLTDYVNKCSFINDQVVLDDNAWTLISKPMNKNSYLEKSNLRDNIRRIHDWKMYWGLKTGYNKAL